MSEIHEIKTYNVYILINNKKPIYVGCTSNINDRLSYHRRNKIFDSHFVLLSTSSRSEALISERAIIKYLSVFDDINNINCKYKNVKDKFLFNKIYK